MVCCTERHILKKSRPARPDLVAVNGQTRNRTILNAAGLVVSNNHKLYGICDEI
jgi:hypothetical protein